MSANLLPCLRLRPIALATTLMLFAGGALAQVSSNASLNGVYYFLHTMLIAATGATVTDTRSGSGTLTFDGAGGFTVSGQQLIGTTAATSLTGTGSYTVKPGGFITLSNPLLTGASINARLATGAVVGSSTEAAGGIYDLFIAIPKSTALLSNTTLTGAYWVSSLEFPNGGTANIRETNFKLTANGAGAFAETSVIGEAHNLSDRLLTQTVSPITYSVAPAATGTLNFPTASGLTTTTQLIAGTKNIYVSQDGSFFIGGSSDPGGHGIVVGVKAFASGATNASWKGFYSTAGLRFDANRSRLSGVIGGVNAITQGAVWGRRTHQSDGLFDASTLATYSIGADGSGQFTSTTGHVDIAATSETFVTTGVDTLDSSTYELSFGMRLPPQSGPALFLNPQGALNAATFAPPGSPIAPGSVLTLFGTGFGTQSLSSPIPFQTTLGGVVVKINGVAAPIFALTPTQLSVIVPFSTAGPAPASVSVTVNTAVSNSIEIPVATTAPGIFTLTQNGLGDAAVRHANFTIVNGSSPAAPEEVVLLYMSGLGAVSPTVTDGSAAPSKAPFAIVSSPYVVTLGGISCEVQFAGLAPGFAGLYQLNIKLPKGIPSGTYGLAVQTPDGFTDMVNLQVVAP
ncbi:MAG: hypothetical protein ABI824_10475 [Acidobacteriota bacterium]